MAAGILALYRRDETMERFREIFYKYPKNFPVPMILDGATGTELIKHGMPQGCCVEKWVLDHRDVMLDIQRGYVSAGSDAVLTPTFGCTRLNLYKTGYPDKVNEFNHELAKISRESGAKLVGGDMSPTGEMIVPFGDARFDDLKLMFVEQVVALEDENVDFYMVETLMNLQEARAAASAVRSLSDKPLLVSFTVNREGKTMFGDSMAAALVSLADMGISAFGCNCSFGPEDMLKILKPIMPLAASLGIAVTAKPNAGVPRRDENGKYVYDMTAEEFGSFAGKFMENGIYVLGGCCGTGKEHIKSLSENAVKNAGVLPKLERIDPSKLVCTSRSVAELPEKISKIYSADDDLSECEDQCAVIRIDTFEDAKKVILNEYSISVPFAVTGNHEAIEFFKSKYVGKTLEI